MQQSSTYKSRIQRVKMQRSVDEMFGLEDVVSIMRESCSHRIDDMHGSQRLGQLPMTNGVRSHIELKAT